MSKCDARNVEIQEIVSEHSTILFTFIIFDWYLFFNIVSSATGSNLCPKAFQIMHPIPIQLSRRNAGRLLDWNSLRASCLNVPIIGCIHFRRMNEKCEFFFEWRGAWTHTHIYTCTHIAISLLWQVSKTRAANQSIDGKRCHQVANGCSTNAFQVRYH